MSNDPMRQTLDIETFGVCDAEYLRNMGFTDRDLKGLYHEEVSQGAVGQMYNPGRLL